MQFDSSYPTIAEAHCGNQENLANSVSLNPKVQTSAKGAKCKSLGHRPRTGHVK